MRATFSDKPEWDPTQFRIALNPDAETVDLKYNFEATDHHRQIIDKLCDVILAYCKEHDIHHVMRKDLKIAAIFNCMQTNGTLGFGSNHGDLYYRIPVHEVLKEFAP